MQDKHSKNTFQTGKSSPLFKERMRSLKIFKKEECVEFSIKMRLVKWLIPFAGTLVLQGSLFGREAYFTGKLVSQGNSVCTETRFIGKLVSQGNSFLVNTTQTFPFILAVKHITCNAKFSEIISFCNFFSKKLCKQQ